MLSFPRWKVIFIALVTIWGVLVALPNFLSEDQRRDLPSFMPTDTVSLGLDLRGGVHLLLEAQTEDVVNTKLENLAGQVRDIRRENRNVNFRRIKINDMSVSFEVTNEAMIEPARGKIITVDTKFGGVEMP